MNGVANPLEFAREREVVKGPHVLDHGTYVPNPGFVPTEYPRYMYKEGMKAKVAANEEEELALTEKGFDVQPPKQKVITEEAE